MKAPTTRQKAEAHVALIRHQYPNPVANPDHDRSYCIGHAASYHETDGVSSSARFPGFHDAEYLPNNLYVLGQQVRILNNERRFEAAWTALTDYYDAVFTADAEKIS